MLEIEILFLSILYSHLQGENKSALMFFDIFASQHIWYLIIVLYASVVEIWFDSFQADVVGTL